VFFVQQIDQSKQVMWSLLQIKLLSFFSSLTSLRDAQYAFRRKDDLLMQKIGVDADWVFNTRRNLQKKDRAAR